MRRRKNIRKDEEKEPGKVEVSNESIDDTSCTKITFVKFILICTLSTYILIPMLLGLIPQIVEQIVFMNLYYAKNEPVSLSQPKTEYGLSGTASFHLECDDVRLGVWHILPKTRIQEYEEEYISTPDHVRKHLKKAEHVIIYHHGNGMSRATGDHYQRTKLYKLFQSEGYHIIAFDYRGFGDSTGWPSEKGLVNDSLCILNWVRGSMSPNSIITYWGHSLGSSVATLAARKATDSCKADSSTCDGYKIDNLILEGAFTNIRQGAEDSSPARVFLMMYPKFIFQQIIDRALTIKQISFSSVTDILGVNCPIMLLHAEDDPIISCKHGDELFEAIDKRRQFPGPKRINFIKFKATHGYGHMDIFKAPELPQLLQDFFSNNDDTEISKVITL